MVVGRIRITPADVGRRVSVRSCLPSDDADQPGPGATDALGTLTAWPAPGALIIARDRRGDRVSIDTGRVIAAKVVPPDTAVVTWQERADSAWGSAARLTFGDWLAHWQPGPDVRDRGIRAGSDPRVPARTAIEQSLAFLAGQADAARAAAGQADATAPGPVSGPLLRAPLPCVHDPVLRELGWRPGRTILFFTRAFFTRGLSTPAESAARTDAPAAGSLRASARRADPTEDDRACTLTADGGSIHITRVDDAALVTGLHVAEAARRRGIGRTLTERACAWAAARGVREVGLQVLADNEPACALYVALGFTVHHRYHYWHPPAPGRAYAASP